MNSLRRSLFTVRFDGTSVAELKLAHDQNRVAITDIDVQGVEEYERLAPDSIAIFIVPPNSQTWIERLKKRYATEEDFQAEWPKRLCLGDKRVGLRT